MITILLIFAACIGYVVIGTVFGVFLYRGYKHFYDDIGSFFCGAAWPIALPIIAAVGLGLLIVHLVTRPWNKNDGWTSK